MKALSLFLALLLIAAGVGILVRAAAGTADGPIYSLRQVEAGLALHPGKWVGKTVRLRAFVFSVPQPCPQSIIHVCGTADLLLDDLTRLPVSPTLSATQQTNGRSSSQGTDQPLLLRPEPDRLLDGLRRIPGLGRLLPDPQSLDAGTFRITVEPAATSYLCPTRACFEAVLPDAADPEETPINMQGRSLAPYQQGMAGFVYAPTPSPSR